MTARASIALFGHPVGHSRSADLFAALADAGGRQVDYELVDVAPNALPRVIDELRGGRWHGANVTIPHKAVAAALADRLVGDAIASGAANVLFRADDGALVGANTDGAGFLAGLDTRPKRALVLGDGGAARGVVAALTRSGAASIVLSRHAEDRRAAFAPLGAQLIGWADARLGPLAAAADLIVQATSLGMHPAAEQQPPLSLELLRPEQLVVDLIYRPWETRFLRAVRARGHRAVNGWPMLVGQAAAALEHWFGPGEGKGLEAAARNLEPRDPWRASAA